MGLTNTVIIAEPPTPHLSVCYEIERYLTTNADLKDRLLHIKRGEIIAITTPTDTGKTTLAKELAPTVVTGYNRVIIALPTIAIGLNKSDDKIPMLYDGNVADEDIDIFFATYDNIVKYDLTDTLVVIDEAHNFSTATYRKASLISVMDKLQTAYATILTTATLDKEVWNESIDSIEFLDIKVKHQVKRNLRIIKTAKPIVEFMREVDQFNFSGNRKIMFFAQSVPTLKVIAEELLARGLRSEMLISKEHNGRQNTKTANAILNTGFIPEDVKVILATSYVWEGIDLLNVQVESYSIELRHADTLTAIPATIFQQMSRSRSQATYTHTLITDTKITRKQLNIKNISRHLKRKHKKNRAATDSPWTGKVNGVTRTSLLYELQERQKIFNNKILTDINTFTIECDKLGINILSNKRGKFVSNRENIDAGKAEGKVQHNFVTDLINNNEVLYFEDIQKFLTEDYPIKADSTLYHLVQFGKDNKVKIKPTLEMAMYIDEMIIVDKSRLYTEDEIRTLEKIHTKINDKAGRQFIGFFYHQVSAKFEGKDFTHDDLKQWTHKKIDSTDSDTDNTSITTIRKSLMSKKSLAKNSFLSAFFTIKTVKKKTNGKEAIYRLAPIPTGVSETYFLSHLRDIYKDMDSYFQKINTDYNSSSNRKRFNRYIKELTTEISNINSTNSSNDTGKWISR